MVARKFTVLLEPAEEGGFIFKCLELPVATQGDTREETLSNIKEAIEGYLEVKAKLLDRKTKGEIAEVIIEVKDSVEKVIVKRLHKILVSKEEKEEIKSSIKEMKKGNYVSLDELKDA